MKKNTPLVSIGFPTYNGSEYIRDALNSLLDQTYVNFKIIISDNASTDETGKICLEYVKKDKRIQYIRQKSNIGAVNNFNYCLNQAAGEYFMWAADDDVWEKKYIYELINCLNANKNSVLAISRCALFNDKNKLKKTSSTRVWRNQLDSMKFFLSNAENTNAYLYGIFKTKILKKIHGYHKDNRPVFEGSSDFLTVFRILLEGDSVLVNKILFYKRDTGCYLNQFAVIKNLSFTKEILLRIKRYLFFPIIYVYDLFYCIKFIFNSQLPIMKKLELFYLSIKHYCKANIIFTGNVLKGFYLLFFGLAKKYI